MCVSVRVTVCVHSHPHTASQVEVSQLDAESQDAQNSCLLVKQRERKDTELVSHSILSKSVIRVTCNMVIFKSVEPSNEDITKDGGRTFKIRQ